MAVIYAVSEFTDEGGNDWKVKIVDGTISTGDLNHAFTLGPDGFRLTYDFDNFDRAKPIIGSRVQFTLFHNDSLDTQFNTLYSNLDTSEEGTYRVEIYKDPDGDNTIFWVGEILPEQTIIPDEFPSAAVTITAVDGLGNLKGIDYNNNGTAYTGTDKITQHLYKALQKVHSQNFWGASDTFINFFEDFISTEYKTHIAGGQNQQLNNAELEHNSFYNKDSDGVKQYYSAYEVIESIAIAFNACVFMHAGNFWFLPLGNIQGHESNHLDIAHKIAGNGTVTYNTSANVDYSATLGSGSVDLRKLQGWERTSAPSFEEVTRERNYQGDKPIVRDSLYDESQIVAGNVLDDEDVIYPAGRKFVIRGWLNYSYNGDGSSSGSARAGRVKLLIKLKVGDAGGTVRYLKRAVGISGNYTAGYFYDNAQDTTGETCIYYDAQYDAATWDASDDTCDIVSYAFDKKQGTGAAGVVFHPIPFEIITPALPAEATGLQLSATLRGYNATGGNDTDLVDTSDADFTITDFEVFNYDNDDAQQHSTVEIKAINQNSARYKFNQGSTLIGDRITDNDLGTILVYNGSDYVDATSWQNIHYTSTDRSINKLGVQERLGANKNAKRIERGTVYIKKLISPFTILTNSDQGTYYYQVTGITFIASRLECDIECMFLSRSITDITIAQDNNKGPGINPPFPPVVPGSPTNNGSSDPITGINEGKTNKITTDAYGITDLKISNGSSGTWDFGLPTAAAAAGKTQPMSIRDDGNVVFTTIGTAGQVLTVNATATGAAFADASGGESGWFNSTTLMKVMPTEFMLNDDNADDYLVIEDDTTDKVSVRIDDNRANGIAYAIKAIPTGYKATHVQVYGVNNSSTSNAITVRNFDHTDGDLTNTTSGDWNTVIDITDITSSATQNILIKVELDNDRTAGQDLLYGADITIAAV